MSIHSHSSFSGGSTASSTRRSEEAGEGHEWDEDPSFSSAHFHTSTPLKSARAVRLQRSPNAEEDEGERDEERDDEGMLRASDTESVGDGGAEDSKSNTRVRLTRRSLSLSTYQPTALGSSPAQQTFTSSRPFSPSASSSAFTPSQTGPANLQPSYPSHLAPGYTPSVSTGSSTLVDRDDAHIPSSTRTLKGKGREDVTIRPSPRAPFSTLNEEDSSALPDDDGSSSSPRPLRSKPRRGVELSTYINSHTSTPPPASRASYPSRSSNPSTPLAPGAYPPTARKALPRRSPPSSISRDTPPSTAGSRQVHDAFQRYITGPSGALIHSAERRAAAAAAAMIVPPSAARRKDFTEQQQQREPPTPHPAGYYAFEASTSLPVEREQRRRREVIPSSNERRREVTWREDVAGGEEDEDEEEEELRAGDSPSHRPLSRTKAPSKLEKTLRHMSQLQRETEGRRRVFEAPPPPPPPDLDDYFAPTAEYEEVEQEQEERARARDYEGDYSSEDEDRSDDEAPRLAGRSAIDFAMARSFAVSIGGRSMEEEAVEEKERSVPAPENAPLPPPASRRSPFRPPSPPSPSLPELPPVPSPQSSPTKPRAPIRRSTAADNPPRHLPPPQTQPSPPRAISQSSPSRAPITVVFPPRTTRQRRPSFNTIPTSSTPPRRFVDPPAPAGTPLTVPTRLKSLSSSLQAPRADPNPTPRRRATSLSPSRSSLPSSGPSLLHQDHDERGDDSLPAIVADLAIAVRALSSNSAAELRRDGLPTPRGGSLAGVLARRKKESEGRTRGLEEELKVLESKADGEAVSLIRMDQLQRAGLTGRLICRRRGKLSWVSSGRRRRWRRI